MYHHRIVSKRDFFAVGVVGGGWGVPDTCGPPFLPPPLPKCICCNKVAHGRGKVALPVFATPLSVLSTAQTSAQGGGAAACRRRCRRRRGGNTANKHRTSLEAFNTSPQKVCPVSHPRVTIRIFLAVHLKTKKKKENDKLHEKKQT